MLKSHWENLEKDTEVVGLTKLIMKGEDEFPSEKVVTFVMRKVIQT